MSCRKFSAPRHGSLAFCPRKRATCVRQRIKAFEKDDNTKPIHLTAFNGYKAGMTHIIRNKIINQKKAATKESFEAVTIIEAPAMIVFGIVGYINTPKGFKINKTIYSSHLNESVMRRFYKKFYTSKRKMFSNPKSKASNITESDIAALKESDYIRVLCHTQIEKIKTLKTKKAHISEIQVNGGNNVSEKVEWALNMLENEVKVSDVFGPNELIDIVAVTKGKGFQGVTKRFGTTILPRKTNKGKRKVACIGAWHPANVRFTVPRAGQLGFHRRTEFNKAVYMLGNGKDEITTDFDLTSKKINPISGFPNYGFVNNDFIMLKGCVAGPVKRIITLRRNTTGKKSTDCVQIKFVDTSSKIGSGRFQTSEEKRAFFGVSKRDIAEKIETDK